MGNWCIRLSKTSGMFPCGHFQICLFVEKTSVFTDADCSDMFQNRQFIHCGMAHLICMLECPCSKYYIGKTKWQLRVHIGKHIDSIKYGDKRSPLAQRFMAMHCEMPDGLKVKEIFALNLSALRDGVLLCKDKMWIYKLGTMAPKELNSES